MAFPRRALPNETVTITEENNNISNLEPSVLATPEKQNNISKETAETMEQLPKSKQRDFGVPIVAGKNYVFETVQTSITPRHQILGAQCRINDTVEGRMRDIRYIPTAKSIFVEDQDQQDSAFKTKTDEYVGFYNNQLIVDGTDARFVEYLLSHDMYEGNKNRISRVPAMYRLLDKEQFHVKEEKRHTKELEALNVIAETPIEDLMPVARILFGITEENEKGIRNYLNEVAKTPKKGNDQESGAEKLLNNLNDPYIRRKYSIQQSIDAGIIRIEQDKVVWEETGAYITTVSSKNSPKVQVNDIAKYSMTKPDGERFYKMLKEKTA